MLTKVMLPTCSINKPPSSESMSPPGLMPIKASRDENEIRIKLLKGFKAGKKKKKRPDLFKKTLGTFKFLFVGARVFVGTDLFFFV